ncbi:DUF4268 domain-containing protein [Parapedobacter sp. SGR-10]|uniref:DUF4268 domain-containing protein n=1 Tax=Parapedobacter sp. SGR-10 TaxID=2710879 RepID=UPI00293BFD2E|nr:DUF4268 domain-containing protein [Parapedobacter sp. SGR-10]
MKKVGLYTKEEAKRLKEKFWTTFGQYMSVVPSADGEKVNWVNYKTGVKYLFFRMDADNKTARISIEIAHPDDGIRHLMYEQFLELRIVFESFSDAEWLWYEDHSDDYDKVTSRIVSQIEKVSIFNTGDWPDLISFFKSRIVELDGFWSMARYSFDIFK